MVKDNANAIKEIQRVYAELADSKRSDVWQALADFIGKPRNCRIMTRVPAIFASFADMSKPIYSSKRALPHRIFFQQAGAGVFELIGIKNRGDIPVWGNG